MALVPHEQIIEDHLQELLETVWRDGVLRQPVIMDRASMVILDEHHRVSAMTRLSCPLIPASGESPTRRQVRAAVAVSISG